MKAIVTGAAGFIGSHLSEKLLSSGYEVIGIDCFTDFYPREFKEKNIRDLLARDKFKLHEINLAIDSLEDLFKESDYVFHLAAQPGVRSSWGKSFERYVQDNILATQRLLEQLKGTRIKKFVFASSSSVYGNLDVKMLREDMTPQPVSPYGVTKLASERLVHLYCESYGLPAVSLRFFTVFGPRQRPDMAFHRLIEAAVNGKEFVVYGDGTQTRDFTFVGDATEACLNAALRGKVGEVYNIGGGNITSLNDVIAIVREITGTSLRVRHEEAQKGDMKHTCADVAKAREELGFHPKVLLVEGLNKQVQSSSEHLAK